MQNYLVMEIESQAIPLPGSDEISRNGSFCQYKNCKIWEGNAYFIYSPPIYGRTGFRRKCWIVQKPNKARWILTGTIEDVERCIDKDSNGSGYQEPSSVGDANGREDESYSRNRFGIRRGFKSLQLHGKTMSNYNGIGIEQREQREGDSNETDINMS